ncbi:MAG TPA: HAD family hydrolase [Polyangiaceae bacterium]|nr:HAD family hydrolase [Polyangiaceae bacterium]
MSDVPSRVVCFDLGGVLVRICQTWAEACARAALPERNVEWLASDAWRSRRRLPGDRYQSGQLECSAYFGELASLSDGLFSAAEFEQIHWAWTLDHYPGALELVRALNALPGVTTACLSNTNHAHWVRLVGADGKNEYPAVAALRHQLASHLLRCCKPDARIYDLAFNHFAGAQASDAVASGLAPLRARDIVFFDDLPENVAAARAAGWTAFQVDPRGDTVTQIRASLASTGLVV